MKNHSLKFKAPLVNRTYVYSISVINMAKHLKMDTSLKIITHQLIKSATSIGANIIEAQASSSKKDFTRFMGYSLKSSNESLYWLNLLEEVYMSDNSEVLSLIKENDELSKILGASLLKLKGKR